MASKIIKPGGGDDDNTNETNLLEEIQEVVMMNNFLLTSIVTLMINKGLITEEELKTTGEELSRRAFNNPDLKVEE